MGRKPVNGNNDPLYELWREGRVKDFNERKKWARRLTCATAISAVSICVEWMPRDWISAAVIFVSRSARCGFLGMKLEGASINGANISGACFPKALPPEEITLSHLHGTRMRYRA